MKFWSLSNSEPLYYDGNDYHIDHLYYSIERAHSSDVNAVDETSQVVISGSGDGTVKIWMRPGDTMSNIPSASISVRDRILSLVADPTGQKFAVGSSGTGDGPPLHILDIERLVNEHKNGVCHQDLFLLQSQRELIIINT